MTAFKFMTLPDFSMFIGLFTASCLISLFATIKLARWFTARSVMAIPDHRSSHKYPTPVGGGWVFFVLSALTWVWFYWPMTEPTAWSVLVGMVALAVVSWSDDRGFASLQLRLTIQIAAIALVLYTMPEDQLVFGDILPVWADRLITGFCWLWFINLFNFMDGIDGITGVETLFICLGIIIIGGITGLPDALLYVSVVILGTSVGFLWWNWSPAKIFLGDIGSITLGFILGWMLIQLALRGYIVAALILPLYYLTDATLTLFYRMSKGEKFWHPHKSHFYQRAAQALGSHSAVASRIAIANLALLGAALLSLYYPLAGAILAAYNVTLLMVHLYKIFQRPA